MFNLKTVAANIRAARLYRNYSQDYVGFKIGVSQNGYSKIELGYTNVTFEKIAKIAEVLEIDISKLIDEPNVQNDLKAIQRMAMVPKMLEVICRSTGMGFAAISRITENKWIACVVRDEAGFGLIAGSEIQLEATICHDVRQWDKGVAIDHVALDETYGNHPKAAEYGFQSYISMPITCVDGSCFGTLCAIDPRPNKINTPAILGMFKLFAELISFHLKAEGFYNVTTFETQQAEKQIKQSTVFAADLSERL